MTLPDTWRIVSYNTMLHISPAGKDGFANARRAQLIGAAGFLHDANVVVLQGLFETAGSRSLLRALARRGFTHQSPAVSRPDASRRVSGTPGGGMYDSSVGGGTAVVSRHPITRAEEHLFPEPPRARNGMSNGFTYAAVRTGSGTLHLIDTHLYSGQDHEAQRIREDQLARLAHYLAEREEDGTLPPEDTVAVAGTLNVPCGSGEFTRMLATLHAEQPTAKTGWPYSLDTTNNTIARRRHARPSGPPRRPAQDLDHVLLRRGHARPSKWNSRVLVSRTPWTAGTRHYTDYSDHQPVLAGACITSRPGRYDLCLTAIRLATHPTTTGPPAPYGTVTVTTDTGGPHTVWECALPRPHSHRPGANLLSHPLLFPAASSFALQTDLLHRSPAPRGRHRTLAYGTVWWQAGARLGSHAVPVEGHHGRATLSFTTRVATAGPGPARPSTAEVQPGEAP
ncbi:sphingomyelin phosphodiesterase [Streptoverticillium reticulum]|uniref:sphingomyelin phosphodiesterase n=1 Tax=Streptoverticillium reticulum TaxID=1433415 RepID=UPI0039BF642E